MTLTLPLNEDQRDCLQELTNVAIGAAAESLAGLTKQFVNLPIPLIRFVDTSDLLSSFQELEENMPSTLVSQHCSVGELSCHALVVVSDESIIQLATCIDSELIHSLGVDEFNAELVKNLFNTISDTCFDSLSEIFEEPIKRQDLSVIGTHVMPDSIDMNSVINSEKMVAVEIYYHTEGNPFNCHLMLLFAEKDVATLTGSLDRLLH